MKTIACLFTTMLLAVLLSGCAGIGKHRGESVTLPPGTLDAAAVTALFSGKTVESVTDSSGRVSLTYYGANGELRQLQNGAKRSGTWKVRDDGRICLEFPGDSSQCRIIVKEGDIYRKYVVKLNGMHKPVVTYRSFSPGNLVDQQ